MRKLQKNFKRVTPRKIVPDYFVSYLPPRASNATQCIQNNK